MAEDDDNASPADAGGNSDVGESERERTKRAVRHAGYVVFIGGGFVLFVTMLVGVVQGIQEGRAWNPYTGLRQEEGRCLERARRLVADSGQLESTTPEWTGRYRDWQVRCKDGYPTLYDLLEETRHQLQKSDDGEGLREVEGRKSVEGRESKRSGE